MAAVRTYAVDRVFQDALGAGLAAANAGEALLQVVAAIPAERRREFSAALTELVRAEVAPADLVVEHAGGDQVAPTQLESAILTLRRGGSADKVVFLRIRDAAANMFLALVTLAVTAWDGDAKKAVVPSLQVLRGLWANLVVLKRADDSNGFAVYEALTAVRATRRAAGGGAPTTAAIAARVPDLDRAGVVAALERLAKRGLIEVVGWGGTVDDMSHPENAWRVRL